MHNELRMLLIVTLATRDAHMLDLCHIILQGTSELDSMILLEIRGFTNLNIAVVE